MKTGTVATFVLAILFAAIVFAGCEQSTATKSDHSQVGSDAVDVPTVVSVAAASDLKFAFEELIGEFEREHPDLKIRATYGSSGNFFAQLSNKAPFDIFFSADINYARQLIDGGLADKSSEFVYGVGQIVVWVPNDSGINVEQQGIQALLDPAVRRIAIANPRHAPYGRAAESALKSLGVHDQVRDRLVLGENIAQTAQYVESGAADVGIIALSLAMGPSLRDKGRYWMVPQNAYPEMQQASVILNWAKDRGGTNLFRSFVAGQRGREILHRYGFILPGE